MRNFLNKWERWSLPTKIGIILGILGLVGGGTFIINPTINLSNFLNIIGTQNNYLESQKRTRQTEAIESNLDAIIKSNKNKEISIRVSVADKESKDFATAIKNFFDEKGFNTNYRYCLRPEKLPDGIFYSDTDLTKLIFFIGVDDGTYIINRSDKLDICSMEVSGLVGGTEGTNKNPSDFLEAGIYPLNQNPDPLPIAKSYSTSSEIIGPCINNLGPKDKCLRSYIGVQ